MTVEIDSLNSMGRYLSDLPNKSSDKIRIMMDHAGTPGIAKKTEDTVNLTSMSSVISAIERTFSTEPVFDFARVEAIQQSLLSGNYHIDTERVADALLKFEIMVRH